MKIDNALRPAGLNSSIASVFQLAARKIRAIDRSWNPEQGTPVFTVRGQYTSHGWTEWTQGFQFGSIILVGDALDDIKLINLGKRRTIAFMLPHVTHVGVHDHGFNNLSTYGNLLRLLNEKRWPHDEFEQLWLRDAICASGGVQAARWASVPVQKPSKHAAFAKNLGYIYSFNGPHSLFIDTMRTIRVLGAAWKFGHVLMHENDRAASLLKRAVLHGLASSQYLIFHGDSDHTYDLTGRTAHEALFNRKDGCFRARGTQQGYSPFSTWVRGLAWAMLGYAEQLEFIKTINPRTFLSEVGLTKQAVTRVFERCTKQTCDHYIQDCTATDGLCYWDTGAPCLANMPDWQGNPSDPYNDHEPIDASAAAIAAQGLIRLGRYLGATKGRKYFQAGLTVAQTLLNEPYLSTKTRHQGLLLHSIYHRPNGWDYVPRGRKIPCGESSMWGDYHLLELANLIKRIAERGNYPVFFDQ